MKIFHTLWGLCREAWSEVASTLESVAGNLSWEAGVLRFEGISSEEDFLFGFDDFFNVVRSFSDTAAEYSTGTVLVTDCFKRNVLDRENQLRLWSNFADFFRETWCFPENPKQPRKKVVLELGLGWLSSSSIRERDGNRHGWVLKKWRLGKN